MPTTKQTFPFTACSLGTAQLCRSAYSNTPAIVPLDGVERVTIQGASVGTTAWSSAVVAVRVSNSFDGPWLSIPGGPVMMTGAGITRPIDVSPYGYLCLECTTAQSGVVADFSVCALAADVPWYAAMLPNVGRTSGKRYAVGQWGSTSNGTITQSTLYAVPVWVGPPQTFTKIVIACISTVGSSSVRLGIYADDGNSKPGALIVDAGTVDTSAGTGEKTATINATVSGLIWVAAVSQGAAANVSRMGNFVASPFVGVSSAYSTGGAWAYSQGSVTGALPDPWGSTYTDVVSTNTVPMMFLVP